MFSALTTSRSTMIIRTLPPDLPTLEQIHDDLAIAGDDDVIFSLRAAGLDIGISHLGPVNDACSPVSEGSCVAQQTGDGKSTVASRKAVAAACEIDSTSVWPIYDKVKKLVEEADRMKNSISELVDDSERMEGLLSELADGVKAVQHQVSSI